jgi:hypothetical protein
MSVYDHDRTVHSASGVGRHKFLAWSERQPDGELKGSALFDVLGNGVVYLAHIEVSEPWRERQIATQLFDFSLSEIRKTSDVVRVESHLSLSCRWAVQFTS